MKKLLLYATAVFTLAACQSEDIAESNLNGDREIRLTSGLDVQTRAYTPTQSVAIVQDALVYAWADENSNSYFNAWKLKADGANQLNCEDGKEQYFPKSGNGLKVYAMHGNFKSETIMEGTTAFPVTWIHHVEADQSSTGGYVDSDLLYAVNDNITRTSSKELRFYHMLSKVEVALKAGSGLDAVTLAGATVRILNTKLKADFKPVKKTVEQMKQETVREGMIGVTSADNAPAPVTIPTKVVKGSNFADAEYGEAVIVPQIIGEGGETRFIEVTLPEKGQLYYKVNSEEFKSGKKYRYNITVNLAGLSVDSSIEDWSDGGGDDNGFAVMEN